ncbi:class I SAM-dependent methyltransferase [Litoribacter populi]|uniref:class I SAM-dependent methyltransferase n=1 Tax=Litoribacter populi TaxID=2598460 RepID=UPI00117FD836|nr:class I SAM-dependent methyltransferase [Litoribacter populi]
MYERLTKCPLCKSGHFNNALVVKDHSVSQESFTICKCKKCELLFTNPRPDIQNIQKYYESEDYISHKDSATNITNLLYKLVRTYTLKQKVSWINQYASKKGRLLDFGCGTGYFLAQAKDNGWETVGLEPNSSAAKIAKSKNGLNVYSDPEDLDAEKKFDFITLFHVLEHVHDLHGTLDKLLGKLKKRGVLMLAVPNYTSWDSKEYGEDWAALDVPRHLYHFTQETMASLAETFDLKIKEAIPMKFDSFYVSLLSESHKNKKKSIMNAILNGYKSNNYAKKNNKNYSSLLYILKKK